MFKITSNNNVIPLWTECRVDQLSHVRLPDEKGVFTEGWFMRTENGLLYTVDLVNFEERNNGLPLLTIKR